MSDEETEKYIINRNDVKISKEIDLDKNIDSLKPIRVGIVNKGGQGERIYHESGHSVTLSAYGGGVGAKTGLYLINGKIRKLAPRECGPLVGFSLMILKFTHPLCRHINSSGIRWLLMRYNIY
ncbi:MAG: hypothetical protein MZU84_03595 [Sphingobacterium sp.]|nr:hypothetical protein [Sphingobacterium sp.]